MRISAKADYAIRALVELAADAGRPLVCEGIAAAQHIPYRFLKSVMRDLRRTGLVRSQRGCEGGYWLGRDAATITLADVVGAVDGELMTVHGESVEGPADATRAPGVTAVWRAIQARTEEILTGVTIADLLTDAPAEPAASLLGLVGSSK
ncbi:RrF2 family transcriptional regulator [Dactylosporangium siamense]|uniref:Rrf2 family transcriptional regulator n=1 Tax=Dactylosporangium siamense TaxID=685454 RepID=A0A919PVW2_9ACTN|nr:Rrf2 family transcriptional regulator [Dactylosporangium siamense]GIG49538.1 Rrf2 family transcriptional regulator [Dactylosporangium siamense]